MASDLGAASDGAIANSVDAAALTIGDRQLEVSDWSDRTLSDLSDQTRQTTTLKDRLQSSLALSVGVPKGTDTFRAVQSALYEVPQSGEKLGDVVGWVLDAHRQNGELSAQQAAQARGQLDAIGDRVASSFKKFDFDPLRSDIVSSAERIKTTRAQPFRQPDGTYDAASPAILGLPDLADRLGQELSNLEVAFQNRLAEANALIDGGPDTFRDAIRANMSAADSTQ